VPPVVVELNDVVNPWHTASTPVIGFGFGFTVTTVVAIQPVLIVYVTVAVPVVDPVTTPPTTVPWALLMLHVPPAGLPVKEIVAPTHTFSDVTGVTVGLLFTVTITDVRHPVGNVAVTISSPGLAPVSTIVEVAEVPVTSPLLRLHVMPAVVVLNDVVRPIHTESAPVIAFGFGFTVTTLVAKQLSDNV
jgi:hypothetical protein